MKERSYLEKKLSKAIYKYALGKMTVDEATAKAAATIDIFVDSCNKSTSLAHKGVDWYAREIAKTV